MGSDRGNQVAGRYGSPVGRYGERGNGQVDRSTGGLSGRWRGLSNSAKIVAGAVGVAVLVTVVAVVAGADEDPEQHDVLWIAEKTTRSPGVVPSGVMARAEVLSAEAGTLTMVAVGNRAREVGSIQLAVETSGGPVGDPGQRSAAIRSRLDDLNAKAAHTEVGPTGFSLTAALRTMADAGRSTTADRVEVWFSTTLFTGSVPPLEIDQLTSADPGQAVEQVLEGALGKLDLTRVMMHPVLLTPVGPEQQELSPASEVWRADFIRALGEGLGAEVAEPVHDSTATEPWSMSSSSDAVIPIVEQTPTVTSVAGREDEQIVRLDNVSFRPDEAVLLDPGAADGVLRQIVAAYIGSRARSVFRVTGYCARVGKADSARTLSKNRAETIATLLRDHGVAPADITVDGVGFDQLADPTAPPGDPRQRVVIVHLAPRA